MQKLCEFMGCNNSVCAKGLCRPHYDQSWRGEELRPLAPRQRATFPGGGEEYCAIEWCENKNVTGGLRGTHYGIAWRMRIPYKELPSILNDRICAICGKIAERPHLDHDHSCCPAGTSPTCGKCVRGVLCSYCNVSIGGLESLIRRGVLENALRWVNGESSEYGRIFS